MSLSNYFKLNDGLSYADVVTFLEYKQNNVLILTLITLTAIEVSKQSDQPFLPVT